jgi:hypothetical protein
MEEKGLQGSNSIWHSIRFWHWPSCSFRWRFDVQRYTWSWLFVLHWLFFLKQQWRRLDTMCEMFQMGAHTLYWYGGIFCLWASSGIDRPTFCFVFVIFCILWLFFVLSVQIIHLSPNYKHVCLNRGGGALRKTNFTHLFSFSNVWSLCNCLFINQIMLVCFEKFYNSSRSLTAVLKNLLIIGDFPLRSMKERYSCHNATRQVTSVQQDQLLMNKSPVNNLHQETV